MVALSIMSKLEIKEGEKGITLVELVVTVGLLVGLGTILVFQGSGARDMANLKNAARKIEAGLIQAQSYGNSGRAFPVGSEVAGAFDKGYGVYIQSGLNQVIVYGGLGNEDGNDTYDPDEQRFNYALPINNSHPQFYESIDIGPVTVQTVTVNNISRDHAHVLYRRGEMPKIYYNTTDTSQTYVRIHLLSREGISLYVVANRNGLIYTTGDSTAS